MRKRYISNMMAALILIAIVAFTGVMLFFTTSTFFRGEGKATITVSATGTGSRDGGKATVNLVVQNTGSGVARITKIYVAPESKGVSLDSVSVQPNTIQGENIDDVPDEIPTDTNQGEILDAKTSKTVLVYVKGENLYAGSQLRIYVAYVDIGSGDAGVVDTVVTLR